MVVLDPLLRLSMKLQRPASTIDECLIWVSATTDLLEELKSRNSEELTAVLESGKYQGIDLRGQTPSMSYKNDIIQGIIQALKSRFDLTDKMNVIAATKIAHFRNWPCSNTSTGNNSELQDFGVEEIKTISGHFERSLKRADPEFDVEEALNQMKMMKNVLNKKYGPKLQEQTWKNVSTLLTDFPQMMTLIDLINCIPPTSVNCETTFSQLKLIKTARRTRLRSNTLDDILMVKLESQSVEEFNPEQSVNHWLRRNKMPIDTKSNTHPNPTEGGHIPQLPPVSIDTMTQGQLHDFVPHLLRIVSGTSADHSGKGGKPSWWPSDIPWCATKTDAKQAEANLTEQLRCVVRSCYRQFGQESSLKTRITGMQKSRMNNFPVLQSLFHHTTRAGKKKYERPFAEIYVCFFCEEEFRNRSDMRKHQELCDQRPPILQAVRTPPKHLAIAQKSPPPISPNPKLNTSASKVMRPNKDEFIRFLNMVPKQKADKIRASHRNSLDIDCEKIDIDEPEPLSPQTPRTPKSLISQMSRDDTIATSRKRLSYSELAADNSDKESVASAGNEESEENPGRSGKSLLTIDVTSLLGQRIQKHVQTETTLLVIPDAEQFCRTPVKNDVMGKLRHRVLSFPVTFKPRKKSDMKNQHQYNFTKKQKREFIKRTTTGLDRESRMLARSIPKCNVVLSHLNNKQLKKWLPRTVYRKWKGIKSADILQETVFPKQPILMSKDVDKLLGLKKRSANPKKAIGLSLANVVSEDINAEASKQKLTLYRCLLSDIALYSAFCTDGKSDNGQQNIKSKQSKNIKASASSSQTSSVLPKHSLNRSDDDISLVSMSSDEESLKSSCCAACRIKKYCRCTPEPSLESSNVKSTSVPVNVPLNIMPVVSPVLGLQDMSPCSCLSSPCSDIESMQKMIPSPLTPTADNPVFSNKPMYEASSISGKTLSPQSLLSVKPIGYNNLGGNKVAMDKLRDTHLSLANNTDGNQLKLVDQMDESSMPGMSLRNNKSLQVSQLPSIDLHSLNDIAIPSSPSSHSSGGSLKSSPIGSPRKKALTAAYIATGIPDRRVLRGSRSDYMNNVGLKSPRKSESDSDLKFTASSSVSPRKSVSLTSTRLRSDSISNGDCVFNDQSDCNLLIENSQNTASMRRSKRLLSSPTSSPSKLRRIETN